MVWAAGTSVPDLLTSMIVAKQGHGDMGVPIVDYQNTDRSVITAYLL